MWAIVAFALGLVLRLLRGETALAAIGRLGDSFEPIADWIAAHGDWFDRASQILYILGALAIALNLWRALQFSNLLLRGARLLTHEVRERRNDLDARAGRRQTPGNGVVPRRRFLGWFRQLEHVQRRQSRRKT